MTERLFLHQPVVIFRARVNDATPTYPADEITFDTVTVGAYGDIKIGMTVLVGSADGLDDYGRQRVRRVALSTKIPVGRSSEGTRDGELTLTDNAYITVLNEYRVWSKIPYIDPATGEIFKDSDLEGSTDVMWPPPKANAGGAFAGTIDSVTGLMTVTFDSDGSFQFDPALSSALSVPPTFLWDVADGTITVGTSASATITATFPAGFRYVSLRVTSDDSQHHTVRVPVYARDPDNDTSIAAFQVAGRRLTMHGHELSIRFLSDIPRTTYPDGCLAMLWDDELEGNPALRSQMLFTGWHQRDEVGIQAQRTATLKDTTLHFVDVLGRLKTLPGFPQQVEYVASPNSWTETRYPNVFYYLWHLLQWHSTALDVADLVLGTQTLNNFSFKTWGSDAGNLFDQVNRLANNITPDHHLTCNKLGQMMLVVDQMLKLVADRSAVIRDTIEDNDWLEIRYGYERSPRVYQLRTFAIDSDSSTITVLHSMAPGLAEGQGLQYIETNERIADSQFDLNYVEGNRYARMNARYGLFTIVVPLERVSAINDPAYFGWVRLTVNSANQPQRTLPFTNQRGLVHEINIAYDYQRTGIVRTATLTWEMETSGPPAVTLELEAEEAV
jgi:hypothetical protein